MSDRLRPARSDRSYVVLRELAQAMRRTVEALPAFDLVVDYGCGDKPYRELFLARGGRYVGVDLPDNPARDAELGAGGKLPFDAGSADVVLSTQVLEHVPDPLSYLSEAARVLRGGGRLLLTTHGVWWYHPHPQDLWRWTGDGLEDLVRQAGFQVESREGVLSAPSAGLQLWQDYALRKVPRLFRRPFCFCVQGFIALQERFFDSSLRAKDAAVFVVVARKLR